MTYPEGWLRNPDDLQLLSATQAYQLNLVFASQPMPDQYSTDYKADIKITAKDVGSAVVTVGNSSLTTGCDATSELSFIMVDTQASVDGGMKASNFAWKTSDSNQDSQATASELHKILLASQLEEGHSLDDIDWLYEVAHSLACVKESRRRTVQTLLSKVPQFFSGRDSISDVESSSRRYKDGSIVVRTMANKRVLKEGFAFDNEERSVYALLPNGTQYWLKTDGTRIITFTTCNPDLVEVGKGSVRIPPHELDMHFAAMIRGVHSAEDSGLKPKLV